MDIIFNLMLTSFLIFATMFVLDYIFHFSEVKDNRWLSEFYPITGSLFLIAGFVLGFVLLLELIWA